jgi:hypothetical protein
MMFSMVLKWVVFAWILRVAKESQPARIPASTENKEASALLKEVVRQGELRLEAQEKARQAMETRTSATATWLLTLAIAVTGASVWLDSVADEKPLTRSLMEIRPALDVGATAAGTALIVSLLPWLYESIVLWIKPWRYAGSDLKDIVRNELDSEEKLLIRLSENYARDIASNEKKLKILRFLCFWPLALLFIFLLPVIILMINAGFEDIKDFIEYFGFSTLPHFCGK